MKGLSGLCGLRLWCLKLTSHVRECRFELSNFGMDYPIGHDPHPGRVEPLRIVRTAATGGPHQHAVLHTN